jgi:hypothetical protein
MSDGRLKQIWAGFEAKTTRRLTNSNVDHIVVPHRADWRAEDAAFLPKGYEAPSATAFAALKTRLAAKARRAERKDGRALKSDSDVSAPELSFAPESDAARDLIRALKATDMRTRRPETLYVDGVKPEKKGLFGGKTDKSEKSRMPAEPAEKPKKRFGFF